MIKPLLKLLKVLNAEIAPGQIAAGVMLGMFLGLTPLFSLHNLLVLFCICIFRVNGSATIVSMTVFSMIAYALDPVFINIGESVLTSADMQDTFTAMYQSDFWRLTHFNNTIVMGSVLFSLVFAIPLFIGAQMFVLQYRQKIQPKIENIPIIKSLKATKLMQMLSKADDMRGQL